MKNWFQVYNRAKFYGKNSSHDYKDEKASYYVSYKLCQTFTVKIKSTFQLKILAFYSINDA